MSSSFPVRANAAESLVDRVHAALPQTQCTKCGHDGCGPYARAIVEGASDIDRCAPGGAEGIRVLAHLLGRAPIPLDPRYGAEAPRRVARIVESLCIGCTKCIEACPVDAIVGASKRMHAVVAELCTGCDLCVAPCPVDCIVMDAHLPDGRPVPAWTREDAHDARARHEARCARLAREREEEDARLRDAMPAMQSAATPTATDESRRHDVIAAAIARARARASTRT